MRPSSLTLILAVVVSHCEGSHSSTFSRRHRSLTSSFVVVPSSFSSSQSVAVGRDLKPLLPHRRRNGITDESPYRIIDSRWCECDPRILSFSSRTAIARYSSEADDSEGDGGDVRCTVDDAFVGDGDANDGSRYDDTFGPLLPIAEAVDAATGGWGLSYADLHPVTPRTNVGRAFLATNFFYAAAGLWLMTNGDWIYGGLTEIAGVVSFVYHYTQLEFGKDRSEVRLALLIDYVCAGSALLMGGAYMVQVGMTHVPIEAVASAVGAVVCLSLCWVWEFGYPYIFWHSLWHLFSAYTGYVVGLEHMSNIA